MRLAVAVLLACSAGALPARAYYFESNSGGVTTSPTQALRWQPGVNPISPVPWLLDSTGPSNVASGTTSAEVRQEAINGFEKWHEAAPSFRVDAPGNLPHGSGQASQNDGHNEIFWIDSGWEQATSSGSEVLGLTSPAWEQGSDAIMDADTQFNSTDWQWEVGSGADYQPCNGCIDAASIATHEEGHFLGMGHSCGDSETPACQPGSAADQAVMNAVYDGTPKPNLGSDDIAGVQALYPSPAQHSVQQGGPCASGDDCVSGLSCLGLSGGSTICTTSCSSVSVCPTGTTCQTASSGKACLPPPNQSGTGVGLGGACQNAACQSGLVCVGTPSGATCQESCNPNGADTCPSGQSCAQLVDQEGKPTGDGACVAGGSAQEGQSCANAQCASGLVCVGDTQADAKCRQTCASSAGCPAGDDCTPLQGGGGACVPGGGGGSGAAECHACGNGTTCATGLLCVQSAAGKYCQRGCASQADCAQGSQCQAMSGVSGYSGVCTCGGVSTGTGAVGATCSSAGECASGLTCIADGTATPGACRTPCITSSDCSANEMCTLIGKALVCEVRSGSGNTGGSGGGGGSPVQPCGCATGSPAALLLAFFGLVGLVRRRRGARG